MGVHRYYCVTRPPTLATIPLDDFGWINIESLDERQYVPEIDRMVWGWVEYDRFLTPKEVADYELISAPREVE